MKITNEDNMQLMARYEDNYFDLAIVDPPYKNDTSDLKVGYNKKQNRCNFSYEHFKQPKQEFFAELFRVSKNQIIWGFNYFLNLLHNTDYVIVWNKYQKAHFNECEVAWCSVKKSRVFERNFEKDMYNKIHPTQKPVKLYEWLLMNYAKEGDKILDTHLGSGSIAIACHNLGFELTACELDKEYYEAAIQRINNHKLQMRIF